MNFASVTKSMVKLAQLACIAVALALAAGCAHYDPKPLSPAANADRLESRSLTNAALKTFLEDNLHQPISPWPTEQWDLEHLSWAAFYYHPSLELALAQWAVARGGEVTAGQHPNPVLTVTPSYNTTTLSPSPWLTVATLDVPIETAGKRGYRKKHAASLAEAARLNIAATAYKVRSDLRLALVDLAGAEGRNQLLREQLEVQQDIVRRIEQQAAAGAISASEGLPMRLALDRAKLDAADARRLAVDARSRLAEAVGLPLHALERVEAKFDLNSVPEGVSDLASASLRRVALVSRPDILNALEDYHASESALQLELAKQYPDIHLQPGYEFDQGDNKWALGISLELPILNHNQGPIAEARARRQESAARFTVLQAKVLAEIDRALDQFRTAKTNASLLRELAQTADQRQQNAEAQFKAGAIDQLEVATARLEAVSARLIRLDGQVKLQQAIGALENALQRPLDLPRELYQGRDQHAAR